MKAVLSNDDLVTLRRLIWLYFWLLLFEGALRKWILPGLAGPLLIVRDPIVIVIYALAIRARVFAGNGFVVAIIGLAVVNLFVSLLVNPGHLGVTIFGLRANFLHLPLIFVIPKVLRAEDLRRLGLVLLVSAVPMAMLVFRQFTAPADAWVNAGAGVGSGQIRSALGKIRAAGTFSYSTGLVSYSTLVAAFLIHHFLKGKLYPKWLVSSAAPALFAIVMLSASRSNVSAMIIMLGGCLLISLYRPRLMKGSLWMIGAVFAIYLVAGTYAIFHEGAEVLNARIEDGGGIKSGLVDRFVDSLIPSYLLAHAPVFGHGVGMGTNAAAGMLTGERGFLLAEGEWERVILESGPFLGCAYLVFRLVIVGRLFRISRQSLDRDEPLAMLLFLSCFLLLFNGQFGQPTALGFAVFTAGLCLAAAVEERTPFIRTAATLPAETASVGDIRGRSVYAEQLHPS